MTHSHVWHDQFSRGKWLICVSLFWIHSCNHWSFAISAQWVTKHCVCMYSMSLGHIHLGLFCKYVGLFCTCICLFVYAHSGDHRGFANPAQWVTEHCVCTYYTSLCWYFMAHTSRFLLQIWGFFCICIRHFCMHIIAIIEGLQFPPNKSDNTAVIRVILVSFVNINGSLLHIHLGLHGKYMRLFWLCIGLCCMHVMASPLK